MNPNRDIWGLSGGMQEPLKDCAEITLNFHVRMVRITNTTACQRKYGRAQRRMLKAIGIHNSSLDASVCFHETDFAGYILQRLTT